MSFKDNILETKYKSYFEPLTEEERHPEFVDINSKIREKEELIGELQTAVSRLKERERNMYPHVKNFNSQQTEIISNYMNGLEEKATGGIDTNWAATRSVLHGLRENERKMFKLRL